MYHARSIEETFLSLSSLHPIIILTGGRWTGKTTLLKYLAEREDQNRYYLSLADPLKRDLAKSNPVSFINELRLPAIIDDIHFVPELLPVIKQRITRNNSEGQFWLSSTVNPKIIALCKKLFTPPILRLSGFSLHETLGTRSEPFLFAQPGTGLSERLSVLDLKEQIRRGSCVGNDGEENFYMRYKEECLGNENQALLESFLNLCAQQTGCLLQIPLLAKLSRISVEQAKDWLALLQEFGIIYLLPCWQGQNGRGRPKLNKLYFLDTGFACTLLQRDSPRFLQKKVNLDALFETWVMTEIFKSWWYAGKEAPFSFMRIGQSHKVICFSECLGVAYPMEFTRETKVSLSLLKDYSLFEETNMRVGASSILCQCPSASSLSATCMAFPVSCI